MMTKLNEFEQSFKENFNEWMNTAEEILVAQNKTDVDVKVKEYDYTVTDGLHTIKTSTEVSWREPDLTITEGDFNAYLRVKDALTKLAQNEVVRYVF